MAERRMFTKKITESDAFLEMPSTAQNLYFHLNMEADDDGFVNAPKKIMKIVGAGEDDFKLLLIKKFILLFDSGVIVIKHWRMHNLLRHDRYHPTQYQDEYKMLSLDKENNYHLDRLETIEEEPKTQLATKWQPNGNQMATEDRIGKDSIGKDSINTIAPTSADIDAEVFDKMPCLSDKEHIIYRTDVETYKSRFPNIDVEQELRNAIAWVEANPKNKKTLSGAKRYITNWLIKSQNRSRAYSQQAKKGDDIYYDTTGNE